VPGRRLFVAVPLPAEATATLARLVDEIRALGLAGQGRDVRWVRLDGLHLTLRFLGPTPEDRVAPTIEAVRAAASSLRAFELVLGDGGAFPNLERPRAIWVDLVSGADQLGIAASIVDASLTHAGWDIEERPFRPHLTLARSDGVRAGAAVAEALIARAADLRVTCAVDRIGLFESHTGGGPARYEPLEIAQLG
jgi:2'-5' RNA ligase